MKPVALAIGATLLLAAGLWGWKAPGALSSPTPAAQPNSADARLEAALVEMGVGLTYLRQAAKTGDPEALRQAEQDVLGPLLDALDLAMTGSPPRPEPSRYSRVLAAVAQAEGLFKYVPYVLEVRPGGELPGFTLTLRRSPWPVLQSRRSAWQARLVDGTVQLTPKP